MLKQIKKQQQILATNMIQYDTHKLYKNADTQNNSHTHTHTNTHTYKYIKTKQTDRHQHTIKPNVDIYKLFGTN